MHADWHLHVYDTKAPLGSVTKATETPSSQRRRLAVVDHETTMKTIKTVDAVPGSWTITDVNKLIPSVISYLIQSTPL